MSPITSYPGTSQGYQSRIEIPLNGMKRANSSMNQAALKISGGDLDPRSFVELMGAQYTFEANAKVMNTMNETLGTLLDTVA